MTRRFFFIEPSPDTACINVVMDTFKVNGAEEAYTLYDAARQGNISRSQVFMARDKEIVKQISK